jgi:pyrroline-5-carboxylate reductase
MGIAIIGCGNMGAGIAKCLSPHQELFFYDRDFKRASHLAHEGYGRACKQIGEVVTQAKIIILAVKPQNLEDVSSHIAAQLHSHHTVISLLAGVSLSVLRKYFSHCHIVRMMPNLALICGKGVVSLTENEKLTAHLKSQLNVLLEPLGHIYWVEEKHMDALTALTGSGPAFIFALIEAMVEAGLAMGLNAKDAQELIIQMIQGSLALLIETGKHPAELKWQVTSPAGTTIAGLIQLEESGVSAGLTKAFLAAYARAQQLKNPL